MTLSSKAAKQHIEKNTTTFVEAKNEGSWFYLVVILLISIGAAINYYKVPPLMPVLMDTFQVSRSTGGLLMSIFAVASVIIVLPGGLILRSLGPRTVGILASSLTVIGAAIGASSHNFTLLVFSRLLEGMGLCLVAILAPTVIANQFGSRRRATAIGIWNAWYPLSSALIFLSAPILSSLGNWRLVWWSGSIFALIAGFMYQLTIKTPRNNEATSRFPLKKLDPPGAMATLSHKTVLLVAVILCVFGILYTAFLSWTPTFLHQTRGYSLAEASRLMTIFPFLGIVSALLTVWIFRKKPESVKTFSVSAFALLTTLLPLVCIVKGPLLLPLLVLAGLMPSMIPGSVFALLAFMVNKGKLDSLAMAAVTMAQSMGQLVAPILFGRIVDMTGNWSLAYWSLLPVGIAGVVASIALSAPKRVVNRQQASYQEITDRQKCA